MRERLFCYFSYLLFLAGDKLSIPFAHFFALCHRLILVGRSQSENKQNQNCWTKRFHYNKSFSIQRKSLTCSYLCFLFSCFFSVFYSMSFHCSLCFIYAGIRKNCKKNRLVSFICANFFVFTYAHSSLLYSHTYAIQWNGMASFNLIVMRQATKCRLQMIWWRRCLWWWNLRPSTSKHKTLINLLFFLTKKKLQVPVFCRTSSAVWSHYYSLPLVM